MAKEGIDAGLDPEKEVQAERMASTDQSQKRFVAGTEDAPIHVEPPRIEGTESMPRMAAYARASTSGKTEGLITDCVDVDEEVPSIDGVLLQKPTNPSSHATTTCILKRHR